ncbi:E3 ubiquitin-protein ligase KCMF1-like [Gymnogyps californianus]|uniref:E3 ubiquitin-protein ligase KCMF1-like n=1 Tax=Gymnogyps californianus TaxID=33616 RepID=UPI0021C5F9E7|nr:E3 ubiquitin-protein ligase KCMF1-like [Gymnogyps californianus]
MNGVERFKPLLNGLESGTSVVLKVACMQLINAMICPAGEPDLGVQICTELMHSGLQHILKAVDECGKADLPGRFLSSNPAEQDACGGTEKLDMEKQQVTAEKQELESKVSRPSVSCDACLKGNFRGRRYKCLICYDYDLCATCYESGATTTRHTTDHPMQCILTRVDFDLYYGGEAFSVEQPQSFTCPYCGKMGYTETSLQEHVASEHAETSTEVICPICAALPGGDPNHVTDDFAAHLTLEHRAPRDLDESSGVRHVRRMFHPGRGLGGPRARRSNMHFTSSSTGGLSSSQSSYSPSNRETMDPIAELLSQLSGVRRSAGQLNSSGPSASQLQQLQMQLQLERQHAQAARQQLETARNATRRTNTSSIPTTLAQSIAPTNTSNTENNQQTIQNSQFLLTRLNDPKMSEAERQSKESERADRSLFVQELLLSTLMREESSSSDEDERGEIADFGAMGCVDIMPLDVALENLNLKENNKGNEPPL